MKAGWEVKTLDETATLRPNKREVTEELNDTDDVSFVPMDCLNAGTKQLAAHEVRPLGSVYRSYTYFRDGDVLLAKITPCFENGKLGIARCLANGVGFGSSEFFVIRPMPGLLPEYIYYFLSQQSFRDTTKLRMSGAVGHKRVPNELLAKLPIPLPSLEEQQRIGAVLDEAFEGLDRARENAEANLENARELFESVLEAELAAVGRSNETSLGEHIDLLAGYAFKSAGYTDDQHAMRLMRGDNIVPGAVRWGGAKYWPIDDCDTYEKFQLFADDVLIAMDRTWIKAGIKYAVLSDDDVPSLLVQRIARLRCLASLDTHFLSILIGSKSFERYVLSIQTGSGVPHISPTQIRDFKIPLPDIDTQAQIVERLMIVKNGSNDLSEAHSKKLQDLDDLRQSLLQKAFAGELT